MSQMNIWSASDYAIKVGEGDCDEVEVTTNSLQCRPPEEKPTAGPADRRDGTLPVWVSRSSVFYKENSVGLRPLLKRQWDTLWRFR